MNNITDVKVFRSALVEAYYDAAVSKFVEHLPTDIGPFQNSGGCWTDEETLVCTYEHPNFPNFELTVSMQFPYGEDKLKVLLVDRDDGDLIGDHTFETADAAVLEKEIAAKVEEWLEKALEAFFEAD